MPRECAGKTGLKMSSLKAKGKPENPFAKKKGSGEFPSMEETNFFDPKSLGMQAGRGSSLPRRKAAPLEMEFGSVLGPGRARSRPTKPMRMKGTEKDPFEVYYEEDDMRAGRSRPSRSSQGRRQAVRRWRRQDAVHGDAEAGDRFDAGQGPAGRHRAEVDRPQGRQEEHHQGGGEGLLMPWKPSAASARRRRRRARLRRSSGRARQMPC